MDKIRNLEKKRQTKTREADLVERVQQLELAFAVVQTILGEAKGEIVEICSNDCGGRPPYNCKKECCGARRAIQEIDTILSIPVDPGALERARHLEKIAEVAEELLRATEITSAEARGLLIRLREAIRRSGQGG